LAKPIVDGIEQDLAEKATVLRLSVMSDIGRQAAMRYGVRSVPTLLVFDGAGTLVEHAAGIPNRAAIVGRVLELAQ
jgi:thioredoxin-related protein